MSLADQAVLKGDQTFVGRVESSMLAFAQNVAGEGFNVLYHTKRSEFGSQVVGNPDAFKQQFAALVATNLTVINEATANNTVVLTTGNVAAQQALVVDTDINNAVASIWNTFLILP